MGRFLLGVVVVGSLALLATSFTSQFSTGQSAPPDSWPLFGGTPARNMVSLTAKDLPDEWSIEEGKQKNIKWSAKLGRKSYGGPVVAGGIVYVGTNNENPRDKKLVDKEGDPLNMAVLMAFDQANGKFLWQIAHEIPKDEAFLLVREMGLLSTPVIDDGKLYYVLSDSQVVCADAVKGKVLWQYDMRKELKVEPFHCSASSPLVAGDLLFLVTGNGVVNEKVGKPKNPKAPSFIALNKNTGKLKWQSNLPGDKIIDGQWSNPAYAVIKGKPQVIFPGGDATIYSFEPDTGKLIWKCHCHPTKAKDADSDEGESYIVATPVIHDDKVYIGLGVYPGGHPKEPPHSFLLCIDATRTGDVSPGKSYEPKAADNKNSAIVWAYGGSITPRPKAGQRKNYFGITVSTCAIHEGLLYITELNGYLDCFDAKTGAKLWSHDFKTGVWGSPLYADGKVYVGSEDQEVVVFQAGKLLKVLNKNDMGSGEVIHSTPVAVGNVLYVMAPTKLYAIEKKKP